MDKRDRLNALAKAYFALAASHREVAQDYPLIDRRRDHHLRLAIEMYEMGVGWAQARVTTPNITTMRREALL
jgi:hypothetical protein